MVFLVSTVDEKMEQSEAYTTIEASLYLGELLCCLWEQCIIYRMHQISVI